MKRGEFYYKSPNLLEGDRIWRYDSVQVVTDEKTGQKLEEKIVWTDSCTYILYPAPGNSNDILKSELFPITVNVLEIKDKYYTVHVVSGDHKTEFDDTAWIVERAANSRFNDTLRNILPATK